MSYRERVCNLHVHSQYSDGAADYPEIIQQAQRALAANAAVRLTLESLFFDLAQDGTELRLSTAAVRLSIQLQGFFCRWESWHDGRWQLAPGTAPAKAPSTWPGSDLALQAGWRTWQTS